MKEICEREYVFAEEALLPIGEYLGFQARYLNMTFDMLEGLEDSEITYRFYFSKIKLNTPCYQ